MKSAYILLIYWALPVFQAWAGSTAESAPDLSLEFSTFDPPQPIPEIMSLKPGGTIPPAVFQKYPAKEIALTVVYKKYMEEEKNGSESARQLAYDYYHDSEVQLSFSEKIIDSVAQIGFLNVHQKSVLFPSDISKAESKQRAPAEDDFVGYRLEASSPPRISAELRPKSAYLSLQAGKLENNPLNKAGPGDNSLGIGGYGNILAVFKDDVKNRTTFTMGDSLLSFPSEPEVRTLWFRSSKPLEMKHEGGPYIEAQVWGPLGFDDVDHFIVNCEARSVFGDEIGQVSPAGLEELEKHHIPIFDCAEDKVDGRLIRIREGKQIYPSTAPPSKVKAMPNQEQPDEAGERQQMPAT